MGYVKCHTEWIKKPSEVYINIFLYVSVFILRSDASETYKKALLRKNENENKQTNKMKNNKKYTSKQKQKQKQTFDVSNLYVRLIGYILDIMWKFEVHGSRKFEKLTGSKNPCNNNVGIYFTKSRKFSNEW